MPSYIGYRPQFNPVSLQEYLAVPTMIQQEFDTYEDKYNENLDKLAVLEGMTDESTRYLTDNYRDKLSNAADIITGKSGSLSDLRRQISNARQYYRETAPRLTNAYNKRQAALKAQQDILLKDPSAVTTKVGNMQSFMDNPDQVFHSLSGDKIYADMINAGKLSAADLSKIENSNLPGYLAKITGYTPQQQQEYSMLVQQALSGNKDADEALRNNPIYTQPYQVLSKYIEDNKFGVFDDSERAYVLNRALSGQLMGMTGHTDYMADKQWEHNSRMSAARATSGAANNPVPYTPKNHLIKPIARVASYGDRTVNDFHGNIYHKKDDGTLTLKSKQDFLSAIGGSTRGDNKGSRTAAQKARMNNLIQDIFTDDGRLRTPEELSRLIKEGKAKGIGNVSGSNIWNSDNVQYYRSMYNQLAAAGVDLNTSYAPITQSGFGSKATSSVNFDKNAVYNNFYNIISNNIADNTPQSNSLYYNNLITIDNTDISNILAATPERWSEFTGLIKGDEGLVYTNKGKKAVKKSDIEKKAKDYGAILEQSPLGRGYILSINNEDEDKYYISEEDFDRTIHNYTDIDYRGYATTLTALEQEINDAKRAYYLNPTTQNRQNYNDAEAAFNYYQAQYDLELDELEKGILDSDVFTSIKEYNPNTSSIRK